VTEEDIGHAVIGAAMKIHTALGPGLLESAYETCLIYELEKQRIGIRSQVSIPIRYEELRIENGYRLDLLVGGWSWSNLRRSRGSCPYIADNC